MGPNRPPTPHGKALMRRHRGRAPLVVRAARTPHPAVQVQNPVDINPFSSVSGDFNRDGALDVVTANEGSNDVSILLGNGDGTFQAPRKFAAGAGPIAVTAGDFNGDGRLDLAVADRGDPNTGRAGASRSSWATATAPSRPLSSTTRGSPRHPLWRATSGRWPSRPGRRRHRFQRRLVRLDPPGRRLRWLPSLPHVRAGGRSGPAEVDHGGLLRGRGPPSRSGRRQLRFQ